MAGNSFRFRESYGKAVAEMDDKRAGRFIKALCAYAFEGKTMEDNDGLLKSNFHLVKMVMDDEIRDRENGRKGGYATAEKRKKEPGRVAVIANSPKIFGSLDELIQELILASAAEAEQKEKVEKGGV